MKMWVFGSSYIKQNRASFSVNFHVFQDFIAATWKFLWRSLEQEHQPSIRHMLEWQVMWLMYRHAEFRQQIWPLFEKVCSLLHNKSSCCTAKTYPRASLDEKIGIYFHVLILVSVFSVLFLKIDYHNVFSIWFYFDGCY